MGDHRIEPRGQLGETTDTNTIGEVIYPEDVSDLAPIDEQRDVRCESS